MSTLTVITALWLATAGLAPTRRRRPRPGPSSHRTDPEASAAAEPDPPQDAPDQEGAVAAAYQAAEAMQGPLDGLWRLQSAGGRTLYIFSLSDAGDAPAPLAASPDHPGVEGAWRDPGRTGAPDASGFIDSVRRQGDWLQIRFVEGADKRPETVTLRAGQTGRWSGELAWRWTGPSGGHEPVLSPTASSTWRAASRARSSANGS